LVIAGLLLWIAVFSSTFGPVYYLCSVKFFPPQLQATAGATQQMWNAFWTLTLSAAFPSAVTFMSGGSDGDKRWGRGFAFMFFAACGAALSVVFARVFKTWDEVCAEEKKLAEAARGTV
jgi:hypothetical protein